MALQKFVVFGIFALTLLASGVNCDGSDATEEKFSVELTIDNFDAAINENNHFVMFFAPWCGHCKRLHPLWEQLAEMMNVKDDAKVLIAKVDCTQQQQLCSAHEITGYPTLRFFKLGDDESVKFKGTRDMPAITEFINQQLHSDDENEITYDDETEHEAVPEPPTRGNTFELTEENFAKHVSSGNHFVKFYAPWCSHCQRLAPTWEELAKNLQGENAVSISKIDCTVYRPICQDFEVKGYPTLLWIEDGKKIEKYSGSRDHDELRTYVVKMLGGDTEQGPPIVDSEPKPELDKLQAVKLSAGEFDDIVAKGVTFVKFYAPWCGHCQELSPTWDKLAEKLHVGDHDITIAKVDCTAADNKKLCMDQQVEGYPTLFAYKGGEKQSEYDGSRSLSDLQQYINKFVGHDEL